MLTTVPMGSAPDRRSVLAMGGAIETVLYRRSDRTWRRAGLAIALLGIPAFLVYRSGLGTTVAGAIARIHLYAGTVVAVLFPWLRKHQASDRAGGR